MRRLILAVALATAAPACASFDRIDRALAGPVSPVIDPGPAKAPPFSGTVVVRLLPRDQVRALCPQSMDTHSLACTDMRSRIITMPDEASSGLSTAQWLALLRHEMLHAAGLAFHSEH